MSYIGRLNIHDVEKVEIEEIKKLGTGGFARNITVYTENGKIEITLFAEQRHKLLKT